MLTEKRESKKKEDAALVPYKEPAKHSFWRELLFAFNSDVVWLSVAVGMLIGVVFFYFGGLQPLLLRSHIAAVSTKMVEIEDALISQVSGVQGLNSRFANRYRYSIGSVCADQVRYTEQGEDADVIDRMEVNLIKHPEPVLDNVIAFSPLVNRELNDVYDTYSRNHALAKEKFDGVKTTPQYLTYIDSWIEACELIEESNGLNIEVAEACQKVTEGLATFNQVDKPFWWQDVVATHQAGVQLCLDLGQLPEEGRLSNFSTFKLEWLSVYDDVRLHVPDYYTYLTPLSVLVDDFIRDRELAFDELNSIYNSHSRGAGIWYLLEY